MLRSLDRNVRRRTQVLVLCHDSFTAEKVAGYLNSTKFLDGMVIESEAIEKVYPEISSIRENRDKLEFLYALTPYLIECGFVYLNTEIACYLDADLFFYSNFYAALAPLEQENRNAIFTEHRFKESCKEKIRYGLFNVGLVAFDNSPQGIKVLANWKDLCRNSTGKDLENGVYGDQLYLNEMALNFSGIYSESRLGFNDAPWNLSGKIKITSLGPEANNRPIIYFHFSGLKVGKFFSESKFSHYGEKMNWSIRRNLYRKYIKEIFSTCKELSISYPDELHSISFKKFAQLIISGDLILK